MCICELIHADRGRYLFPLSVLRFSMTSHKQQFALLFYASQCSDLFRQFEQWIDNSGLDISSSSMLLGLLYYESVFSCGAILFYFISQLMVHNKSPEQMGWPGLNFYAYCICCSGFRSLLKSLLVLWGQGKVEVGLVGGEVWKCLIYIEKLSKGLTQKAMAQSGTTPITGRGGDTTKTITSGFEVNLKQNMKTQTLVML